MVDTSYNSLKGIGKSCNTCYLSFEDTETQERLNQQAFVKKQLCMIISSGDDWKQTAKQAFEICNRCTHEDPMVFQFLENAGIKF